MCNCPNGLATTCQEPQGNIEMLNSEPGPNDMIIVEVGELPGKGKDVDEGCK